MAAADLSDFLVYIPFALNVFVSNILKPLLVQFAVNSIRFHPTDAIICTGNQQCPEVTYIVVFIHDSIIKYTVPTIKCSN